MEAVWAVLDPEPEFDIISVLYFLDW